jgi:hypothetical protein
MDDQGCDVTTVRISSKISPSLVGAYERARGAAWWPYAVGPEPPGLLPVGFRKSVSNGVEVTTFELVSCEVDIDGRVVRAELQIVDGVEDSAIGSGILDQLE